MGNHLVRIALAGVALCAAPAFAHHSGAMYDDGKTVEVQATVKEFQWTNPHAWLAVTYMDASGAPVTFELELGSPVQLVRQGWRPKTVAAGDRVTVSFHPHREGIKSGLLVNVKLPSGTTLGSD